VQPEEPAFLTIHVVTRFNMHYRHPRFLRAFPVQRRLGRQIGFFQNVIEYWQPE